MDKMLISVSSKNELRVALMKDKLLYDLDVELPESDQKKANIYKGRITRLEPSLEAAFIDYGVNRHGFLPLKDISRSYFKTEPSYNVLSHPNIKDVLKEGQEILVQVEKEERGNKGAALTTFISLAGSHLVLMPNNPRAGGVSRRIEGQERDAMRDVLSKLNIPEGMGVIIRTAGVGRSVEELQWDLDLLLKTWEAILNAEKKDPSPCLIYQEGDAVMRAVRDYLRQDIEEIIVDNPEVFEKTKQYVTQIRPDFINRVKLYQSPTPLFSFYQIERQIETAYQRVVHLPSGGSIVIDPTEALVSIDVNSARATGGGDIEETALNTNIEAADEIARQLRLRDIGGLIVIDFIDMLSIRNQRQVSSHMRKALEFDRAKVQVSNISRFGLLEMSRQRLRARLGSGIQVTCPRCDGQGTIRSIESLANSILRVTEEEAVKHDTLEIQIQVPLDMATYLLNEERTKISDIEQKHNAKVLLIPNNQLQTPNYSIKRIRRHDARDPNEASYQLIKAEEVKIPEKATTKQRGKSVAEPKVKSIVGKDKSSGSSLVNSIKDLLKKIFDDGEKPKKAPKSSEQTTIKSTNRYQRGTRSGATGRRYQGNNSRSRSGSNRNNRGDRSSRNNHSDESSSRSEGTNGNSSGSSNSPRRSSQRGSYERRSRSNSGSGNYRSRGGNPKSATNASSVPNNQTNQPVNSDAKFQADYYAQQSKPKDDYTQEKEALLTALDQEKSRHGSSGSQNTSKPEAHKDVDGNK